MLADMNIRTHLLLNVAIRESEINKAAVNFSALNYLSYNLPRQMKQKDVVKS